MTHKADVIAWCTEPQTEQNNQAHYVIECSECGLLGISQSLFVRGDCAQHLRKIHKVRNILPIPHPEDEP